jgi:hypothetical protein
VGAAEQQAMTVGHFFSRLLRLCAAPQHLQALLENEMLMLPILHQPAASHNLEALRHKPIELGRAAASESRRRGVEPNHADPPATTKANQLAHPGIAASATKWAKLPRRAAIE